MPKPKVLRCPNCKSANVEPLISNATHVMYWCHGCWTARRKPPVFELPKEKI